MFIEISETFQLNKQKTRFMIIIIFIIIFIIIILMTILHSFDHFILSNLRVRLMIYKKLAEFRFN